MEGMEGSGGKAKKLRKRYDIQKTASCTVCGDLAAEHLHYGGIACYSCRAFFRRTVNSNRPILDCSGDQNCKINKETRKRCQWCRFEKCKLVGMKTTWVLTEDDKTKLALRRDSSPVPGINIGNRPPGQQGNICIKKEETLESDGRLDGSVTVKRRHASSPTSPKLDPYSQFQSPTSPYFSPAKDNACATDNAPFTNQFYPFPMGFKAPMQPWEAGPSQPFFRNQPEFAAGPDNESPDGESPDGERPEGERPESERPGQQAASLFPLNINKMQVNLTGANAGVSFTIETHNTVAQQKPNYHQEDRENPRGRWDGEGMEPHRHLQQSRTIFRCVNSEPGSSRPPAGASPDPTSPDPAGPTGSPVPGPAWPDQQVAAGQLDLKPDNSNVNVWKLDLPEQKLLGSPQHMSSFTLHETLFVEQLSAIDERTRGQVPMDQNHVRAFLNTSVLGTFITKMTIMHAYQTCIKRIVRFANSLQDFVELPPEDMQKLLVANTVSIINIKIVRWLHPSISLKQQLLLCGGSNDLFQDALEEGKVTEHGPWRVNYDDLFCSPWCSDAYYEDRYNILMKEMHNLSFDSTIMVLLSVMCLFDCNKINELLAKPTILKHRQKFSLLLHRYLLKQTGEEEATANFYKYQEGVPKLREMAEILINKRLIC